MVFICLSVNNLFGRTKLRFQPEMCVCIKKLDSVTETVCTPCGPMMLDSERLTSSNMEQTNFLTFTVDILFKSQ